jgi:hypothetical protein
MKSIVHLGSLSAAGSFNTKHSGTVVTHLLITSTVPFVDADKLKLTLSADCHERKVIVPNVSMLALQELSNIRAGASQTLQQAISGLTTTDYVLFAFLVDVGYLNLQNDNSELTVEATWSQAASCRFVALNLRPTGTDYILYTFEEAILSGKITACESLFIYLSAGTDAPFTDTAINDINVTVNNPIDGDSICTLTDCIAATACIGNIEAVGPRYLFMAYEEDDPVCDDISYKITGSDADADIRIIAQSKIFQTDRVISGIISGSEKFETKMNKRSDKKNVALEMAGVVSKGTITRTKRAALDAKKQLRNKSAR